MWEDFIPPAIHLASSIREATMTVLSAIYWHHVPGFLPYKCQFKRPQTSEVATCSFKHENRTENQQMVLLNLNNKISAVYQGSTYVWNSAHNSASALDQREAGCSLVCVVLVLLGVSVFWCRLRRILEELWVLHSSILCSHLLGLCPTAFLLPTDYLRQ